jgi:hypothetical protein
MFQFNTHHQGATICASLKLQSYSAQCTTHTHTKKDWINMQPHDQTGL